MGDPDESLIIGIDVGATKIAAVAVTPAGSELAAWQEDTQADKGPDGVLRQISDIINQLVRMANNLEGKTSISVRGVGIGIPGQVNKTTGVVRQAVNLGWDEVPLVAQLKQGLDLDVPVVVDTDTNACTLGEYYYGAARGCADFIFLSIGSGLGAGLFVNQNLVTGTSWKAAELGHISLDIEGIPCKCGLRGCPETIVSGPGLVNLTKKLLEDSESNSPLGYVHQLTPADIISAARSGDPVAIAALSEMGHCLGTVISFCSAVTNPGLVVIGGGLGKACFELILDPVMEELTRRLLPSLYSHMKIIQSKLKNSAIGAACLVMNQA